MAHKFHELYGLFPKLDCGLCGNPSCRTMARKVATGDAKPEQCVNMSTRLEYRENLQGISKLLSEGIEIGAKGTVVIGETGVTYIHPCISEVGRVTAEAKLTSGPEGAVDLKFGFFDPIMLCWALETSGLFKDVKCSPSLGVARVMVDDKTVMVFKDGRMNVRRARDKIDAIETIRLVSRSLWGSIICSCCGNSGVDCASGGCEDCLTRVCPVIGGGPPDPAITSRAPLKQTTASTIFERVKELPSGIYFQDGSRRVDEAVEIVERLADEVLRGPVNLNLLDLAKEKLNEANKLAIRFIVETPRVEDATIGLILAGASLDVSRVVDGLSMLAKEAGSMPAELKDLFMRAIEIVGKAYQAYRRVDLILSEWARNEYMGLRGRLMKLFKEPYERSVLVAIEKIAVNGFYIARLLTKPLPA